MVKLVDKKVKAPVTNMFNDLTANIEWTDREIAAEERKLRKITNW